MLFLEVGHSKGNIKKKLKQIFIFFMVLLMRNYNLIFVLIFFSTSLEMIFFLNGFFFRLLLDWIKLGLLKLETCATILFLN